MGLVLGIVLLLVLAAAGGAVLYWADRPYKPLPPMNRRDGRHRVRNAPLYVGDSDYVPHVAHFDEVPPHHHQHIDHSPSCDDGGGSSSDSSGGDCGGGDGGGGGGD